MFSLGQIADFLTNVSDDLAKSLLQAGCETSQSWLLGGLFFPVCCQTCALCCQVTKAALSLADIPDLRLLLDLVTFPEVKKPLIAYF